MKLLELIDETGSIRKAAVPMKMSYRRAWLLLQALEEAFGAPLVATATGGKAGGGARLTPLGRAVVARVPEAVGRRQPRRPPSRSRPWLRRARAKALPEINNSFEIIK